MKKNSLDPYFLAALLMVFGVLLFLLVVTYILPALVAWLGSSLGLKQSEYGFVIDLILTLGFLFPFWVWSEYVDRRNKRKNKEGERR